jgi:predicted DCC family thiol-disulfide oxidoreductase YuxK
MVNFKNLFTLDLRSLSLARVALAFFSFFIISDLNIFLAPIYFILVLSFMLGLNTKKVCLTLALANFIFYWINPLEFNYCCLALIFLNFSFLPISLNFAIDNALNLNHHKKKSFYSDWNFALPLTSIFIAINSDLYLLSIIPLINFLPAKLWKILKKESANFQIYYDGDCKFCLKMCLILKEFFLPKEALLLKGQSEEKIYQEMLEKNSWIIKTHEQKLIFSFEAIIYATEHSYLCFLTPILKNTYIKILGEKSYQFVSNNRSFFGNLTSVFHLKSLSSPNYQKFKFLVIPYALLLIISTLIKVS